MELKNKLDTRCLVYFVILEKIGGGLLKKILTGWRNVYMNNKSLLYSIAIACVCALGYPFNLCLQQVLPWDHGGLVGLSLVWLIYTAKAKQVKLHVAIIIIGVVLGIIIGFRL